MSEPLALTVAVFCPPVHFLERDRRVAGFLHLALYAVALATVVFGVGMFFWVLGAWHACVDLGFELRERGMQRQAQLIAWAIQGQSSFEGSSRSGALEGLFEDSSNARIGDDDQPPGLTDSSMIASAPG